jgi:NHL repeat-containing protein
LLRDTDQGESMKRSVGIRPILETGGKGRAAHSLTLLCLLIVSIVAGAATATADDAGSPGANPDNLAFYLGELTNSEAAEELPHVDLGRDEALDLASAVFAPALQNPAGIYDELDVEEFHADNVAVIAAGDQPDAGSEASSSEEPTLLTSTTPLATRNAEGEREAVDLSLEPVEGELQPANPLVDLGIPGELDQGISLPDTDIKINVAGAPDRAPSIAEQSTAFYPNVAQDTDFIVAPTPDGVETLTQLRSPEAPRSQTFNLSLPAGAELKEAEAGGAKVIQDDKAIVVIPPPTAYDAEGTSVPVSLEVSGKSLTITASPAEDAKYPVLVDPLYEQPYVWLWNNSTDGMYDWTSSINDVAKPTPWAFNFDDEGYISGVGFFKGLSIQTSVGTVPTISRGRWTYYVPRYHTDYNLPLHVRPTSYVKRMMLKRLWFKVDEGTIKPITSSPGLKFGIWNEPLNKWTSEGVWWGTQGNLTNLDWEYISKNDDNQVGAKFAKIELEAHEPQLQYRNLLVGEAAIELSDSEAPEINEIKTAPKWVDGQSDSAIPFTATDPGLGVKEIVVKHPNGPQIATKGSCTGIASKPCPRTWSSATSGLPSVSYSPQLLPQGENFLQVEAVDPIGKRSPEEGHGTAEARIKVDHTNPKLAFSGSLVEHATKGTKAAQYTLKYDATDGDHAAAAALTPFGSTGTAEGKFQRPQGLAIDAAGNIWVVDRENNRVMKFDETGKFLLQFGGLGSADGKFNDPRGIAISSFGTETIWISDLGNKRVQAFNSNGEFIRKITKDLVLPYGLATGPVGVVWVSDPGTGQVNKYSMSGGYLGKATGSAGNPGGGSDLNYPVGLATDPAGNVWVADTGNSRIKKYSSDGQFITQFGTTGAGAGQLKSPLYLAVAPSGNLLVTEELNNRIQVFQPNGIFQRQFGSTGTGNAQLSEPRGVAITADNNAFAVDTGNRRVVKWSHADFDPQSGVVSTQVEVDGQPAEAKYAPGCETKSCAVSREWTLDSNDLPSGTHKVKVTAIDGVDRPVSKELTFTTDATPPQLNAPSQFFTAPEGWLEQKSYSYTATASDTGGYGVKSLVLKIDDKVVAGIAQGCPNGGCSLTGSSSINMANYKGGAHPAELVATDAAGNSGKKAWTINVAPKGTVPIAEAEDTLEAVEDTSSVNLVGESAEEEEYTGTGPDLGVKEISGGLEATGTQVPVAIDADPSEGMELEILQDDVMAIACDGEAGPEEPSEEEPEPEEPCSPPMEGAGESEEASPETVGLTPISVSPIQTAEAATPSTATNDNAAVAANTASSVDTVVRPLSDGGMTFQNIRDKLGPESFSWEVSLEPDQELRLIDSKHVQVNYESGRTAFTISAIPAHDAVGTDVPTKLTITGDGIVTLTVEHKAQSFTYPVIAGAGWQGGYRLHVVEMPPEESSEEEGSVEENGEHVIVRISAIGPPVASASSGGTPARRFKFSECRFQAVGKSPVLKPIYKVAIEVSCMRQVEDENLPLLAGMTVRGWFHVIPGEWVWVNEKPADQLECIKWGPRKPAMIHCETDPDKAKGGITARGAYRAPWGAWIPNLATCVVVFGHLKSTVPYREVQTTWYDFIDPAHSCNWPF